MTHIATHFPKLQRLELADKSCDYGEEWFTDNVIKHVGQCLPLLQSMTFSSWCNITVSGFQNFLETCTNLHTLTMGQENDFVTDVAIQSLCLHCPNLLHIDIFRNVGLTDKSLNAIAVTYPNLQSMHIRGCSYSNAGLLFLASKCHELRSLALGECNDNTNTGLTALWAANPNLVEFDLNCDNFVTDDDIMVLGRYCPHLRRVCLDWCENITDDAVIELARLCPKLSALSITYLDFISDASLEALGQHCHELKSIDISFVRNITGIGVIELAVGCPQLQEFEARASFISSSSIVALATCCRDLRNVDLKSCQSIHFHAIYAMTRCCRFLSHLDFSSTNVDDDCVLAIAQHCPNLRKLYLSGLSIISMFSVQAILAACRQLTFLLLPNCCAGKQLNALKNKNKHVLVYCFGGDDTLRATE